MDAEVDINSPPASQMSKVEQADAAVPRGEDTGAKAPITDTAVPVNDTQTFQGWSNSTDIFNAPAVNNRSPFELTGILDGSRIQDHPLATVNATNNQARFAGNMGMGGDHDTGCRYANAHILHSAPRAFPTSAAFPAPATTCNISVATGMTYLASHSDTEAAAFRHAVDHAGN